MACFSNLWRQRRLSRATHRRRQEQRAIARATGTRLTSNTREDLAQVIIIIDASRVQGVQLAALPDYVRLHRAGPGQSTQASTTDYPTIMNFFSGAQASQFSAPSTAQWDQAFLDALYKSTRNAVTPTQQRSEIARRMLGTNS
ncbi:MAG: hypothetical protein IPL62_07150 [Caulobacteraceae bacterium]|nr:hypothetical protein [Caulobacteraceae bacterium]